MHDVWYKNVHAIPLKQITSTLLDTSEERRKGKHEFYNIV
jgi:hypothetical protein